MKSVTNWIVALSVVASIGGLLFATAIPQSVAAASNCSTSFIGFPAWYDGLTASSTDCSIVTPDGQNGHPTLTNFILRIALNILKLAMIAVGYIAAFFILYGGFQFLTSRGSPDSNAKARKTILDAAIGLVISLVAVGIVGFIAGSVLK
jgi:hypothetical protein